MPSSDLNSVNGDKKYRPMFLLLNAWIFTTGNYFRIDDSMISDNLIL